MNRDPVSTHLLETFVEVARLGSVSEAASFLGRSQPAISQRIRQLEDELGVALFRPQGRGVVLTRDGESVLDYAREIMAKLRAFPGLIDAQSTEPRGILRIGALATVARYVLVDAIHQMVSEHADVQIRVEVGLEHDLLAKLRDGWLDLVYFIGDIDSTGLQTRHLRDVPIVVASKAGTFAKRPTLKTLSEHRLLIWAGARDPSFSQVEKHARTKGLYRNDTVEISHIDSLKALAELGTGYTVLPDYVLAPELAEGTLETHPFPGFKLTFPFQVVWNPETPFTQAMRVFDEHATQTQSIG